MGGGQFVKPKNGGVYLVEGKMGGVYLSKEKMGVCTKDVDLHTHTPQGVLEPSLNR